jgi:hypothetical protein
MRGGIVRSVCECMTDPALEAIPKLEKTMKAKMAMSFLGILLLAGTAYAQETRTELKRADLTGTNMEIWTAVYEITPGTEIPRHSHNGEEIVYVIAGGSNATSCTPASLSLARAP